MADKKANQIIYAGKALLDLTGDTVTPETLGKGVTAHDKAGAPIVGTMASEGMEVAEAEVTPSANSTTITFAGLIGEPVVFVLAAAETVTLSTSRNVEAIVYDGSSTVGRYGYKSTSTASTTYTETAYTWTYEDGSLTVRSLSATSGGYFKSQTTYRLTYAVGAVIDVSGQPSGTLEIAENGTYDVARYAAVEVDVPSVSVALPDVIAAGDTPIAGAWEGAYISSTTATDTGLSVTIPKDGTYRFYIPAYSASSYSTGTSSPPVYLYKNGVQAAETSADSSPTAPLSLELACAAGDVIAVWAAGVKVSYTTTGVRVLALIVCIDM